MAIVAVAGFIPYATTFANFGSGRVYDQIRQSVAYSGANHLHRRIAFFLQGFVLAFQACSFEGSFNHDEQTIRFKGFFDAA